MSSALISRTFFVNPINSPRSSASAKTSATIRAPPNPHSKHISAISSLLPIPPSQPQHSPDSYYPTGTLELPSSASFASSHTWKAASLAPHQSHPQNLYE
ncbi:unnamed protein product [Prunus armeniaca]|uniref:Uncharacterized protein n=1 Tax=Prunus armeniaca TaxID=36596 RepID=A0A6J5UZY1_PRUAR|nr:unnamed protein product [Prunus armeniaca]CAB4311956.1 unnamed protein product [Prunus armeniaca]